MNTPSCKQRWASKKNAEIKTLRKLWRTYQSGVAPDPDFGSFEEHGLAFDYVPAGTFSNQRRGYWRYQISWGGPSDEFRFYGEPVPDRTMRGGRQFTVKLERIEYAFLDWFDGYSRKLTGGDEKLLREIWDWLDDCGAVEAEHNKALLG